jgi:hypothetical protein
MTSRAVVRRVLVALAFPLALAAPAAAAAQGDTPTTDAPPATLPHIIPQPNTGQAPTAQGERGTGEQYVVMGLIVAGLGGITALIARESKAKLAAQKERGSGA